LNAQTGPCRICLRDGDALSSGTEGRYVCLCTAGSQVIESAGDQSWAAFCGTLEQPAFLLAITGFGDLEQS
jgi:hypothetical protein